MFFARSFGFQKFEIKNSFYTSRVSDGIHLQFYSFTVSIICKLIKERITKNNNYASLWFVRFLYEKEIYIYIFFEVILQRDLIINQSRHFHIRKLILTT